MKRSHFIVVVVVVVAIAAAVGIRYFTDRYSIDGSPAEIEAAIERSYGKQIDVRNRVVTGNKLHFIFTDGQTVGSGELTRGWNRKYKLEYFGYGTNQIRERIVETNNGQYLMLAGRNDSDIGSIRAFIEGDEYEAAIPEDPYYIVMTPVQRTKLAFTSAMIVYDRTGKEIQRINLAAGEER